MRLAAAVLVAAALAGCASPPQWREHCVEEVTVTERQQATCGNVQCPRIVERRECRRTEPRCEYQGEPVAEIECGPAPPRVDRGPLVAPEPAQEPAAQ